MAKKLEYIWHSSFKPNKGMITLVKQLRKKYKVFVLSGNTPERVKYLNKKYSLNKLFDGYFYSFDCGVTKPNPKFLKIVLKKLKASPQQCLLIDDSNKFNEVAKKLGLQAIRFKDANQLIQDLNRRGIF
jgi:putative hydrolase of the HAD superfamily